MVADGQGPVGAGEAVLLRWEEPAPVDGGQRPLHAQCHIRLLHPVILAPRWPWGEGCRPQVPGTRKIVSRLYRSPTDRSYWTRR